MYKILRTLIVLTFLGWPLSPLSGTIQTVSAAPLLTVSPSTAAPGDWVQVSGSGFTPFTGTYGLLQWDSTSVDSAAIGRSNQGNDGSLVFDVQVPPTASAGTHFFYVRTVVRAGSPENAQVNITVTNPGRKIALITGSDAKTDDAFKALLDANGLLTTEIKLSGIAAKTSFSAYDEVLIAPDTAPASPGTWGTPAAMTALAKFGKPILGLGDGGYYFFGNKQLYIGYGNGIHSSSTGIIQTTPSMPIYHTPYAIPNLQSTTLFTSTSAVVEIYTPQIDSSYFEFAQTSPSSPNYYVLMQEGRYFLWGFDGSPSTMTADGQHLLINVVWYLLYAMGRDTLIVSDLSRMQTAGSGFPSVDVTDLNVHLTTLVGRPYSQSNMSAAWVDLAVDAPAIVGTDYINWASNMGDVGLNNTLAHDIDSFLENLKHAVYPNLKYFILVGSQEIIPMYARAVDNADETSANLPAGYLRNLYHSTAFGATLGHYLTDSVYSDLSYINDGWGADTTLMPEMSVGRLVETPFQINALIDTYLASNASMSRANMVSIASDDYLDGATSAANAMGSTADTGLIQDGFLSSLVPTKLNAKHGVVYIGGHGDYNWMTTRKWDQGFMAGSTTTQGDTEELVNLDNAVIAAAGCHNGVLFPDLTYYSYDGTTNYGEFPERLANKHVGVYAAATGYTWITLSGSSTNPAYTDYSEKATSLFIQHLLNDGGTTAGKAFQAAVKQYLNDRGVGSLDGGDRRAISILTFYGFPTYRFSGPIYYPVFQKYAYSLAFLLNPVLASASAPQAAATVTLDVDNYIVNSDGTVTIAGADYSGDSSHPILPVVTTGTTLPGAVSSVVATLDTANSTFVTLTNDIPAVHAGSSVATQIVFDTPPLISYSGFYPTDTSLIYSTTTNPLGGGGTELNFGVVPVQYDHDTHTTKIWTHMVFNITYNYTADAELSTTDSDEDGLPDWWEEAHGLDPYSALGINGAAGDPDKDGLTNQQEYLHGTDPMNPDTDRDGFSDGFEVSQGTDPLNPGSVPQVVYLPIITH
jgi:hypothetical protein